MVRPFDIRNIPPLTLLGSMNAVPSLTALDLPLTVALRPGLTDGSGAVGNSNRELDSHCEYGRY